MNIDLVSPSIAIPVHMANATLWAVRSFERDRTVEDFLRLQVNQEGTAEKRWFKLYCCRQAKHGLTLGGLARTLLRFPEKTRSVTVKEGSYQILLRHSQRFGVRLTVRGEGRTIYDSNICRGGLRRWAEEVRWLARQTRRDLPTN